MPNFEKLKQMLGAKALEYIQPGSIVGVGTGTTINHFIKALSTIKNKIEGAVASSEATAKQLRALGIEVFEMNSLNELSIYIDGADEANHHKQLIKGGGGALTREKILASFAKQFICLVDHTKVVDVLGKFPVAVEVIPMARSYVARRCLKLGAMPVYRQGFTTDNGNVILDLHNLKLTNPQEIEYELNNISGLVSNGIFADRKADVLLISSEDDVKEI